MVEIFVPSIFLKRIQLLYLNSQMNGKFLSILLLRATVSAVDHETERIIYEIF